MKKKYMRPHHNCPYYDKDKAECSRKGCLFLTPCTCVNESYARVTSRIIKRKGT